MDRCTGLRLLAKERAEVEIQNPEVEVGPILVGKFYTKRRVNLESVARVLKIVWKTKDNFEVSDLGENRALFLFKTMDDLDRVMLLGPLSYDKYLLTLHNLQASKSARKVSLDRVSFWVQIHGLPTMSQMKEIGKKIGETLDIVEKTDVEDKGFCMGSCLHIRVLVKTTEPLCRGRNICLGRVDRVWVDFKYERLPIFCYWCGMVDHDEKECIQWIRSTESMRPEEMQFGAWLRDASKRPQKPQMIEAMRHGGRKVDGDIDKTNDGMACISKAPMQLGQGANGLRVGISALANLKRNDVEGTRKLENQDESVKSGLMLANDFEKKLAEIDAGIHGDASRMLSEERAVIGVKESCAGQYFKLMLFFSSGLNRDGNQGPYQQPPWTPMLHTGLTYRWA